MIVEGKSRRDWRKCAKRIIRERRNESARLVEVFGLAGNDLAYAFQQMYVLSLATRCENFFYHASINPRAHELLTERQWQQAVDILARHLGLEECSRFVVERIQNGRIHRQVVWLRLNWNLKVVSDYYSWLKHQSAAREMEALFGLEPAVRRKRGESEGEAAA